MFSPRIKKPIRTYARQRQPSLYDEPPPAKRRRVVTTPPPKCLSTSPESLESSTTPHLLVKRKPSYPYSTSPESSSSPIHDASACPTVSPKDDAPIFSDGAPESTSSSSRSKPSSSPWNSSPPPTRMRRPIFTFMKRKTVPQLTAQKKPLAETRSAQNIQTPTTAPPRKKQKLVQMQLDLVGELRRKCPTCGMEYIPSNTEDASLHKKFHAQNVGGVNFTKAFIERSRHNAVWEGGDGSFIAVVGRRDGVALRNKAAEVLRVVNTELAAVSVGEESLWSLIQEGEDKEGKGEGRGGCDRFKVYLYIRGSKCVGACLAERIQEAFAVVDSTCSVPATPSAHTDPSPTIDVVDQVRVESSSISISSMPSPALLGISRIWTSKLERKKGIATSLLDAAREDFLYGMRIEKVTVAFSQPTGSGGNLARKWFGRRTGWHVYIDEN